MVSQQKISSCGKIETELYKDVAGGSIDEAVKQVTNSSTSAMLEKASNNDIAGLQSFTIRNLDNRLSTESDIDQYKLLSVREQALDNRQMHLDVRVCFREKNSEFIKSRLYNKESRFRKEPQYVFYLLWQKELRELSSGIYNMLKTLLNKVQSSDEQLEANLCTMLQSVRGTKQCWFTKKSELTCMIRVRFANLISHIQLC